MVIDGQKPTDLPFVRVRNAGSIVNSVSEVCDQKILVFVLQMEESKQSMWIG
jgi:hypothetical protein